MILTSSHLSDLNRRAIVTQAAYHIVILLMLTGLACTKDTRDQSATQDGTDSGDENEADAGHYDADDESGDGMDCDTDGIEQQMNAILMAQDTIADYVVMLRREDGHAFVFESGQDTRTTGYRSASTSKWVTSAIVLWLVERTDGFTLESRLKDFHAWDLPDTHPLSEATLAQLLSFTSGVNEDPPCLSLGFPRKTFDACINDLDGSIVSVNRDTGTTPGSGFSYGSSHMQLAGQMAVLASQYDSWQEIAAAFHEDTGLFSEDTYQFPTLENPRLAGGMLWTPEEYMDFLEALSSEAFISEASLTLMREDHIGDLPIVSSPVDAALGWRYGLGVWLECDPFASSCISPAYYSSAGAFGSYPFISFEYGYYGLIAMDEGIGSGTKGFELFYALRELAESWASCYDAA